MLTAMLGVWWAGGAYVPLDPGFPQARLTAMARGAELGIIISDSAHRDLAQAVAKDATIVCVDDPALRAASPLEPTPVPAQALAYVIFTSGSTGQPKGVAVEHRAVANLLASFRRSTGLGRDDRFVAVTTLSFDIARARAAAARWPAVPTWWSRDAADRAPDGCCVADASVRGDGAAGDAGDLAHARSVGGVPAGAAAALRRRGGPAGPRRIC